MRMNKKFVTNKMRQTRFYKILVQLDEFDKSIFKKKFT